MGEEFWQEGKLPGFFSKEAWVDWWIVATGNDSVLMLGLKKDEKFVGGLGAALFTCPSTGDLVAQELFWFVHPAARGSLSSMRLVKQFEKWAISKGAHRIIMVHLPTDDGHRIAELYKMWHYRYLETVFVKEL